MPWAVPKGSRCCSARLLASPAGHPAYVAQSNSSPQAPRSSGRTLNREIDSSSFARLLAKRSVHQLFNELHALEFQELRVLFQAAIERHTHLPRSRKYLQIFDSDLVQQGVGADR